MQSITQPGNNEPSFQSILQNLQHAAKLENETLHLDPNKLTPEDLPFVTDLFSLCFEKNPENLKISIEKLAQPRLWYVKSPKIIPSADINSTEYLQKLFLDPTILSSTTLFVGLLDAAVKNNRPINLNKVSDALKEHIIDATVFGTKELDHFIKTTNYLYQISNQDNDLLEKLFRMLLRFTISKNMTMDALIDTFGAERCKLMLKKLDGNPYYFLHIALKEKNYKSFNSILSLQDEILNPLDDTGNTFLHLCTDKEFCKSLFTLVPDINQQNADGNTPLHIAAKNHDINLARLFLQWGADPEIKNKNGESFWTMPLGNNQSSLDLYRGYEKAGKVLQLPPDIVNQEGPNCAFYAVACAVQHHYEWKPDLFQAPPLPARKKDSPNSTNSLRQLRKEAGIPGQGAVFTATGLANLINKTACKSVIWEINNYEDFMKVIKLSIDKNFPVIIPFSTEMSTNKLGNPATDPKAEGAHWATIIGYASNEKENKDFILAAQFGKYFDLNGSELYKSFFDIEDEFPKRYLYKYKKKGEEWNVSDLPSVPTSDIKTDVIPVTDLKDFKRKLIVVLPPDADPELFKTTIQAPAPTLNKPS